MKKNTDDLKLIRTKTISYKKQKKIKTRMNIMFILGFIIPTAFTIYQQINVKEGDEALMYAMYAFIALDIILYLPIFIIQRDPYTKGKNRLMLLILLQIRQLEKFIFALYMLIYFILTLDLSFNMLFNDFVGTMKIILDQGVSLAFTVVSTLFTMICGGNNNKCRRELFDGSFTYTTYERDNETKDIIRKTYINNLKPKAYIKKRIIMSIFDLCFIGLVLFTLIWLLK